MARQYVKVRGVGGGHAGTRHPSAPRVVSIARTQGRASNGKRKA